MSQKQVSKKAIVLTFILLAELCAISFQLGIASKKIVVPDNYSTISEAVANALSGDTIFVKSGVYNENLMINKSLSLVGEHSESTIIIGSGGVERGQRAVFTLASDQVKVEGFTIQSMKYSSDSHRATGISVEGDNCTIIGNIIRNNFYGIFCSVQSFVTISKNIIDSNFKDGIRFCGGSVNEISENIITGNTHSGVTLEGYSNTILRNEIRNNGRGIGIGSSFSVVFGNNVVGNSESGFFFAGSNNVVSANNIIRSKWGIYFTGYFAAPNGNEIFNNNFAENEGNIGASSIHNVQFWDRGYSNGGNYWSDYEVLYPNAEEVDASGIGNLPYVIDHNDFDNYPLLSPFDILSKGVVPFSTSPPIAEPNSVVALWSFDEVEPGGIVPDETGLNPAVLGLPTGNVSFTPTLVKGKFGKALSFDGAAFVNARILPSLEIAGETTIDVWINLQELRSIKYNNILVEGVRTRAQLPDRTFGLAVNGETLDADIPQGALRAYVATETEGLNEIATTESVIPLNEWTRVVFTRSLHTGMHIYVNGEEKSVTVVSGVSNPQGQIKRETELYIGHDAVCFIDEVCIYNMTIIPTNEKSLWTQWWFWTSVVSISLILILFLYYKRKKTNKSRILFPAPFLP